MRVGSPRTIGLAASGLIITGWLLGSTLSPPVARSEQPARARPAAGEPMPSIAPLRLAVVAERPAAPAPAPRRNPFSFGARREVPAAAPRVPSAGSSDVAAEEPPPTAAPAFPWRLLGVAVDADGHVTAILAGHGDVQLVRAGDRLPDDALVLGADATGVQIRGADGVEVALRLP